MFKITCPCPIINSLDYEILMDFCNWEIGRNHVFAFRDMSILNIHLPFSNDRVSLTFSLSHKPDLLCVAKEEYKLTPAGHVNQFQFLTLFVWRRMQSACNKSSYFY